MTRTPEDRLIAEVTALRREVEILKRVGTSAAAFTANTFAVPFDRQEADTDTVSKAWLAFTACRLAGVTVSNPDAQTTSITVKVAGVTVHTVSMTGGTTAAEAFAASVPAGGAVTIGCADVGFELVVSVWVYA